MFRHYFIYFQCQLKLSFFLKFMSNLIQSLYNINFINKGCLSTELQEFYPRLHSLFLFPILIRQKNSFFKSKFSFKFDKLPDNSRSKKSNFWSIYFIENLDDFFKNVNNFSQFSLFFNFFHLFRYWCKKVID